MPSVTIHRLHIHSCFSSSPLSLLAYPCQPNTFSGFGRPSCLCMISHAAGKHKNLETISSSPSHVSGILGVKGKTFLAFLLWHLLLYKLKTVGTILLYIYRIICSIQKYTQLSQQQVEHQNIRQQNTDCQMLSFSLVCLGFRGFLLFCLSVGKKKENKNAPIHTRGIFNISDVHYHHEFKLLNYQTSKDRLVPDDDNPKTINTWKGFFY